MDRQQKERLSKLMDSNTYFKEKLVYSDLLLLLEYDPQVQDLIRALLPVNPASQQAAESAEEASKPPKAPVMPEVEEALVAAPAMPVMPDPLPSPADIFYQDFAAARAFLAQVQADAEIAELWLLAEETPAAALMRLLARASQWDQVLEVWDILASRCKRQARPATSTESHILQSALAYYNLTLNQRQAGLVTPPCPGGFDHQVHTRATAQGETVYQVWLPGIENAAGKLQKKPLVATR